MSQLIESIRVWTVDLVALVGPTGAFGAAGAVVGGLVALSVWLTIGKLLAWRPRTGRVASLVARGATRAEIARRTGISQDAVGMLLHVRAACPGRRNLPVPARIAASQRGGARRRNRDWNPQTIAVEADRGVGKILSSSARPLPSAVAPTNRLTRAGRTG